MTSRENLEKIIRNLPDPRLAMFVISCHMDKPLMEAMPDSVYQVPIQAGAALTEKRICDVNDFDGAEDTISEQNQRYSEMTAMYWIGQNLMTEYIGISHYRRRFLVSDQELSDAMNQGFDIITAEKYRLRQNIADNYQKVYYGYDWKLFHSIMERCRPEVMETARRVFNSDIIHPHNMFIFRREIYSEYCDFVFPVLEEYCKNSAWKKDIYQRRDAGFIGERLTSLFVEMKLEAGCRVYEAPFYDLRSKDWKAEEECDLSDGDAVYEACRKCYARDDIAGCRNLVAGALKAGGGTDKRILQLADLFHAVIEEQKVLRETMFEYLPQQWKQDLDTLREAYVSFGNMVRALGKNPAPEAVALYRQFLSMTGFSEIAVRSQCQTWGIRDVGAILEYGKV